MFAVVTRISCAPVKGLSLTHPAEIELEQDGMRENRRFYLIGETGRLVNGKALGTLTQVVAESDADGTMLVLRFPGGDVAAGGLGLGSAVETNFYGRRVTGRVVEGPWAAALSEFAGARLRLIRADEAGAGSDRGARAAVSLVSAASLQRLAAEAGVASVDDRRFRMLFTIDGVAEHDEDGWVGREVRVGDAVVRWRGLVGRCAVTTQDPDTGVPTLDTLRLLRAYRGDLPTDEPLPFGIWGEVVAPGRVRLGDVVEPL